MKLDFAGLNSFLMPRAQALLSSWLPGGSVKGDDFVCGNLAGDAGKSLVINLRNGKWIDHATGEKGGDLIMLYQAIKGLDPGDAFRALAAAHGFKGTPKLPVKTVDEIGVAPVSTKPPNFNHPQYGEPEAVYAYQDQNGTTLHYISRYVEADGKKQFIPYSWSTKSNRWVHKAWPRPRPLYGLPELAASTSAAVLIVEGEKAHAAARAIHGLPYVVITWSGGAQGWKYADWSPIKDRRILIWPDADQPGVTCAHEIAAHLAQTNSEIKIINTDGYSDGEDAADFDFTDFQEMVDWARPRAVLYVKPEVPQPVQTSEAPLDGYHSLGELYQAIGLLCVKGVPVSNVANAVLVLAGLKEFEGQFWYDRFHNHYFTTWPDGTETKWNDVMTTKLQVYLQGKLGLRSVTPPMVESAMALVAYRDVRSEPNAWISKLQPWDGVERIHMSLHVHFGVPVSEYSCAVSRNFYLSLVARIVKPGCKVDTMMILEGKQGTRKSSAMEVLGGKFYTQNHEQATGKDFKLVLRGSFLIEIAELESFSKSETTKIKAILSDANDNFRIPYGKLAEKFPRQSIFVGTTNADEYLSDETGARRFWPVKAGAINLETLAVDRLQMFAEALHLINQGATWWEIPEKEAKEEQDARYVSDVWEDVIEQYVNMITPSGKRSIVSTKEILEGPLVLQLGMCGKSESNRIGKIMRRLGFKLKTIREGEGTQTKWVRNAK